MKCIRVEQPGGPEVLSCQECDPPRPGKGEALVRIEAVGVNFIDVYFRTGQYPKDRPFTPGLEAAGTVEAVSADVTQVREGDRVAYASSPGAYAEKASVPESKLVPIPDGVDFKSAAAAMLQGMTAHYLCHSTYPVRPGDTVLVHAAAGGVGLLLTQMAKHRGARVIGTVSTREKEKLAREAGADEIVLYEEADFAAEVRSLTRGEGVAAVYDSVGRTTFEKSLDCLKLRGVLVLFGQSSGPVSSFDPQLLNSKGSLFLTRPSLFHYISTREELLERAHDVLGSVAEGKLKIRIGATFALSEAAEARRALEGRRTAGKVLLIP